MYEFMVFFLTDEDSLHGSFLIRKSKSIFTQSILRHKLLTHTFQELILMIDCLVKFAEHLSHKIVLQSFKNKKIYNLLY